MSPVADREALPKPVMRFRRKLFLYLLLTVLLLALAGEVAYLWQYRAGEFLESSDFAEYWGAGQLLLQGGNSYDLEALYQVERAVGARPMVMWTPPWTPILLLPLLFLPFPVAAFLWFGLSLIILVLCATALWRIFTTGTARQKVSIAWAATLIFAPALFELRIGQISMLVLLGVVGFLFFVTAGREELAGLFLALTLVKPHVVYLLLIVVAWWLLRERRWRVLLGFLGTMAVLIGALLLISPNSLFYYWQAFQQTPPTYWCPTTLGGALRALFGPEQFWLQFVPTLIGALVMGAFLLIHRPHISWLRDLPLILLLSVPTSAYGWVIDEVVLLPAYLLIWAWLVEWPGDRKFGFCAIPAVLLLINGLMLAQNVLRMQELYFLWAPVAFGLVYLYGWWTLKRNAPTESLMRESQ